MKKYILLLFSSISLSTISFSQCASAGNDTIIEICKNTPFNLDSLLSDIADINGAWYNTSNMLINNTTIISSNIPGEYTYTYVVNDTICATYDTALVLVKVVWWECYYWSIDELPDSFIQLSPNPASEALTLTLPDGEVLQGVKIYNALGQEVLVQKTAALLINVAPLESGFYTLELAMNDKRYAKRFVKI